MRSVLKKIHIGKITTIFPILTLGKLRTVLSLSYYREHIKRIVSFICVRGRQLAYFFGIILVIVVLVVLSVIAYRHFTVRNIIISGTDRLLGIDTFKRAFLPTLKEENAEKKLLELNPVLLSISLEKKYPDTISIDVIKHAQVALLSVGGGFYHLAADGTVLSRSRTHSDNKSTTTISYYQKIPYESLRIGRKIYQKDILFGLYFIERMRYYGITIAGLDIRSPDMILLKTDDQKEYIFTVQKSKEEQFEEFKIVLKKLIMDKVAYQAIDFRFVKPVVRVR